MGVRVRQKTKGKGNPWWVFISHNGKGLIERWAIRKQPRPSPVESGQSSNWGVGF